MRQALDMLALWAPPDPEDALELLGPAFTHADIRRYAISRLNQAPDDDLMLYLLQLVQALKYEDFESIKTAYQAMVKEKEDKVERNERLEKNEKLDRDVRSCDSTSTPITTVSRANNAYRYVVSSVLSYFSHVHAFRFAVQRIQPAVGEPGTAHGSGVVPDYARLPKLHVG